MEEIEIKFAVKDTKAATEKLRKLGFRIAVGRHREKSRKIGDQRAQPRHRRQLVILARELPPECSTIASEERLTSPATIGLSAIYPAAANRCGLSITTAPGDPGTDGPSIGTDADRRGIVPARLKDRPRPIRVRQVDVIGHQTIGPD